MSNPLPPLAERLLLSARDLLFTPILALDDPDGRRERARQLLIGLVPKKRVEDTPITPEEDQVKKPRLMLTASEEGRTKAYAPIRTLRLEWAIRANSKLPTGRAETFLILTGALETFLDGLNLKVKLTSQAREIAVLLAVRSAGIATAVQGDIRTDSYAIDVRAVGLEHTA